MHDVTNSSISIHALLAESDDNLTQGVFNLFTFLSTLSLRRATFCLGTRVSGIVYFYPRSPCGERLHAPSHSLYLRNISIHALLAESDHQKSYLLQESQLISIHALLAESDSTADSSFICSSNFYPRSPCGERRRGANHVIQR